MCALHWCVLWDGVGLDGGLVAKKRKKKSQPSRCSVSNWTFSRYFIENVHLTTGCIIVQTCKYLTLYFVDYKKKTQIRLIVHYQSELQRSLTVILSFLQNKTLLSVAVRQYRSFDNNNGHNNSKIKLGIDKVIAYKDNASKLFFF